jgi:hypothetical protein
MSRKRNQIAPQNNHNATVERRNRNRKAFTVILGDAGDVSRNIEPIDGWYQIFKTRSTIAACKNNFDQSATSRNPAAPSVLDFFCDVESTIRAGVADPKLLENVWATFITGESDSEWLTPAVRDVLAQRVGRLFVRRKLFPVHRYFISIRNTNPR